MLACHITHPSLCGCLLCDPAAAFSTHNKDCSQLPLLAPWSRGHDVLREELWKASAGSPTGSGITRYHQVVAEVGGVAASKPLPNLENSKSPCGGGVQQEMGPSLPPIMHVGVRSGTELCEGGG